MRDDRPSATDCPSGKYGYRSEHEARLSALAMAAAHNGARRLKSYECDQCHAWHTSGAPGRPHAIPKRAKRPGRDGPRAAPRVPMGADAAMAELERMNRERTGTPTP